MTDYPNVLELDLTEIEGRDPYTPPKRRLAEDGRRDSRILVVNQIRTAVDAWRADGYPGVTDTTRRLLAFWFDDDHLLPDGEPFRFYFCQREAVDTLIYLFG